MMRDGETKIGQHSLPNWPLPMKKQKIQFIITAKQNTQQLIPLKSAYEELLQNQNQYDEIVTEREKSLPSAKRVG